MTKQWKKRFLLFWKGWGWSLVVTILVVTSFRSAIADWNDVPTGSMKPTILEGDRIFVNKLAYDLKVPFTTWRLAQWDDPQRGDIVVFYSPSDGKRLVKRVVGLPGDLVGMWKNQVFLNGAPLKYDSLDQSFIQQLSPEQQRQHLFFTERLQERQHPVMLTPARSSLNSFTPVEIPEDHYFMMGDNRDNSADSRFFGVVERRQIVGQATGVVLSLNYDNYYLPRWQRFFSKLP
ncbi:MAG: signal peptidase I [bacterium]|nr:signal peptidase I [bacterium]